MRFHAAIFEAQSIAIQKFLPFLNWSLTKLDALVFYARGIMVRPVRIRVKIDLRIPSCVVKGD
jgi:hypothetical protein